MTQTLFLLLPLTFFIIIYILLGSKHANLGANTYGRGAAKDKDLGHFFLYISMNIATFLISVKLVQKLQFFRISKYFFFTFK